MCLVAPYRVARLEGDAVEVRIGGQSREVFAPPELMADLAVDDHVLVAGGIVIRRLDRDQAEIVGEAVTIAFGPAARGPAPRARGET